jgi:large subunit ribosomal protein L6
MTDTQIQSRVGKRPIEVPKGVTVTIAGDECKVEGPKGKLSMTQPESVTVEQGEGELVVKSDAPGTNAPRLQGLGRALLANLVQGASQGYERILELHGTGYRSELKGRVLVLNLGLSHQVLFELPASVTATIPGDSKGTVIILNSPDKAAIGQAAATIRSYRPPEPYSGKGVRYRGEQVRRKAGKAGKK